MFSLPSQTQGDLISSCWQFYNKPQLHCVYHGTWVLRSKHKLHCLIWPLLYTQRSSRDSLQESCLVKQEPFKCLLTFKGFKYPTCGFRCQVFCILNMVFGFRTFWDDIHLRLKKSNVTQHLNNIITPPPSHATAMVH